MRAISIKLTHWANHCKEYLAKLTGPDEKFTFQRQFVSAAERNWSRSGKGGTTVFETSDPGVYEIQEPSTGCYGGVNARRYFQLTETGEVVPLGNGREGVASAKGLLGLDATPALAVQI